MPPGSVHVGNLAATTGVSRFGERRGEGWSYSKEEGLAPDELAARGFDYLVTELEGLPGYEAVGAPAWGFTGLRVGLPGLTFRTAPMVHVLRRAGGGAGAGPPEEAGA